MSLSPPPHPTAAANAATNAEPAPDLETSPGRDTSRSESHLEGSLHKSSIRSGLQHAPAPFEHDDDHDTFHQMLSIHLDQPVGSMSISPSNRDVALGARKGLFIVDLQNPWDPPRFLPHHSPWEVADVQWNPFPARSEWVVSTSCQQVIVYNLDFSPSLASSHIEHTLHAHTRACTDINWSPGCAEILATCGLDGWVFSWDLRTGYGGARKPVWGVCSWGSGATQVKWNRREPHIIASAHDNKVLVWDDRFGAAPVTEIRGHDAKIYGIDWSRKDPKNLITCSLDKSFKSWNLDSPSQSLLAVQTSSPVWRARFLPFGDGVLTLPQRTDHGLSIWGLDRVVQGRTAEPVARFEGAREGVKEFVWRTRGGADLDIDDRQFQLVTWAKDRQLRLWPISDEIMRDVGHEKGSPITIPMTRRGGGNISYRTYTDTITAPPPPFSIVPSPAPAVPRHLVTGPSLLSATLPNATSPSSSLLASSLLAAKQHPIAPPLIHSAPPLSAELRSGAATMTTSSVRSRKQKAHARLAWMEGVRIIKAPTAAPQSDLDAINAASCERTSENGDSRTQTRSSSLQRGTDGGTAREGGETERADSVLSPGSTKTGTAHAKDSQFSNLGEEFTTLTRKFPRVRFEKCSVASRSCTVSLYSPLFLRATFTFPRQYPHSAPPSIELERNADVTLKSRAALLQGVRKLMAGRAQRGAHSLEPALRFLLGDRSVLDETRELVGEDDDDDEVDDALEDGVTGNVPAGVVRLNLRVNVPPPRRCGASFGARGQLVVFFPIDILDGPVGIEHGPAPTENVDRSTHPHTVTRLSEAFGAVATEPRQAAYQETDEALQLVTEHTMRASATLDALPFPSGDQQSAPAFSTLVKIKNVAHLDLSRGGRVLCPLKDDLVAVTRAAALSSAEDNDMLLVKVWSSLECLLQAGSESSDVGMDEISSLLAEMLPNVMAFLVHLRDIATLGVIACLLEALTRYDMATSENSVVDAEPPTVDNFSHRNASPLGSGDGTPFDSRQTPLASRGAFGTARPSSSSPKPSWANLSGFFNNTVLSLRSGVSSASPGSLDRPVHLAQPASISSLNLLATANTAQFSPSTKASKRTMPEDAEPIEAFPLNSGETRPSFSKQPILRTSRTGKASPSVVTFGQTRVALISGSGPNPAPNQVGVRRTRPCGRGEGSGRIITVAYSTSSRILRKPAWWLSDRARLELELLRLAYADLLHRWGFHNERLRVLKYCFSVTKPISSRRGFITEIIATGSGLGPSSSISIHRACSSCRSIAKATSKTSRPCNHRPETRPASCSLCHLPVTSLSSTCLICAHVAHTSCSRAWFASESVCATGCGCDCLNSGGIAGVFVVRESHSENVSQQLIMHCQS
ncbi:BQ5605_C005g03494 [Microbotryum silenes-dioicae]|uniref:BQ5605_C005g03494 protein n=1 Tax=Microbotryum silenes-dioicae TaxID=796604 RepID=A0A2X0MXY5_9BASI|nr:BQ5605_C005g03494 [Microbotryum silenes-dioicae]